MTSDLRSSTLDLTRPFTRAAAIAAGITDRELRSSRFVRLHTGVYVDSSAALTPILRAEAAVLSFASGTYASHATAARAHQVDPAWQLHFPGSGRLGG